MVFLFVHSGPSANLFQDTFYKLIKERLNPEGIICAQGEVSANLRCFGNSEKFDWLLQD